MKSNHLEDKISVCKREYRKVLLWYIIKENEGRALLNKDKL